MSAWRPNLGPQTALLRSPAFELLYGGQAGGGKSEGLVMGALRYVERPEYHGIILRRTFPELETSIIPRSKLWYPGLGGDYNKSQHVWTFPSGSQVRFGYLESDDDVEQFQSSEFQYIAFDELTLFTERQYVRMMARARSSAGIPVRIRSGTNPGGEGHDWVQRRWAPWLGMPPGEEPAEGLPAGDDERPLWYVNVEVKGEVKELWLSNEEAQAMLAAWHAAPLRERLNLPLPLQRVFIRARIEDNPKLAEADPAYAQRLMALDAVRRAQLLRGDWSVRPAAGMYFQRGWFGMLERPPEGYRWVRHWDLAGTEPEVGKDPDWTVGTKLGISSDSPPKLCVAHVESGQWGPAEVENRILKTAALDGPEVEISLPQDPGQAGKFQAKYLVGQLQEYRVRAEPESGDKVTRAGPISSQCEHGNVSVVRGRWNDEFFRFLEGFPEGKKDHVDSLSGAHQHLTGRGRKPGYHGQSASMGSWSSRRR